MKKLFLYSLLVNSLTAFAAAPAQAVVTIDWVPVGDPGNACDPQPPSNPLPAMCHGAVSYDYRIGTYEVTNGQYTEFLNAVAETDTNTLYGLGMSSGIMQSGSSGNFTYSVITSPSSRADMPVIGVTWYSSLRFANWLHNGQPTGVQDSTTTEDGAYDMSLGASAVRKTGWKVALASRDEWYKAAYYKGGGTSAGYWDYPVGSDTQTTCTTPGATANTANCDGAVGDLTDVGSYTGSASPSGTFDQGGNVWELNESVIQQFIITRAGDFSDPPDSLAASSFALIGQNAVATLGVVGFRVAAPPDTDSDGVPDMDDNCPFVPNNSQTNSDPLPAGDACQCGDVNTDFVVDDLDAQIARENLVGHALSGSFDPERCNVTGNADCGVDDVFVLERIAEGLSVSLQNVCDVYLGP